MKFKYLLIFFMFFALLNCVGAVSQDNLNETLSYEVIGVEQSVEFSDICAADVENKHVTQNYLSINKSSDDEIFRDNISKVKNDDALYFNSSGSLSNHIFYMEDINISNIKNSTSSFKMYNSTFFSSTVPDSGIFKDKLTYVEIDEIKKNNEFNDFLQNQDMNLIAPTDFVHIDDEVILTFTFTNNGTLRVKINDDEKVYDVNAGIFQIPLTGSLSIGNCTVNVQYLPEGMISNNINKTVSFEVRYWSFNELQDLINQVKTNNQSEINLTHNYVFQNDDQIVSIPENITINGNYHDIDCDGQSGIFNVIGDNVLINKLILIDLDGAAFNITGDDVIISDVNIMNSKSRCIEVNGENTCLDNILIFDTNDVAVQLNGKNTQVYNMDIINNNGTGIKINGEGSSLYKINIRESVGCAVEINGDNNELESIAVLNSDGVGISITGVENIVSDVNISGFHGFGIEINAINTKIGDIQIENHTGSGVFIKGYDNNITKVVISNSTGIGINMDADNTKFYDIEIANNHGIGIEVNEYGAEIDDIVFTDSAGTGIKINANNVVLKNSSFYNNVADCACVVLDGNKSVVDNVYFINNVANIAPAILINGADATVENSLFTGNDAEAGACILSNGINTKIKASIFKNNSASVGAALVLNGVNVTIFDDNVFEGNIALWGGDVALGDNAYGYNISDNIHQIVHIPNIELNYSPMIRVGFDGLINVTIENALGNVSLYIDGVEYDTKVLNNCQAVFNVSGLLKGVYQLRVYYNGGASYIHNTLKYVPYFKDVKLMVRYSNFQELQEWINQASQTDEILVFEQDWEFQKDNDTKALNIPKGVKIDGNGHFISGENLTLIFNVTGDDVVVKNLILKEGLSDNGGAVVWRGNRGLLENVTFINNTAKNGGAVYWSGDDGFIKDSIFENNYAETGGGIVLNGKNPWVTTSTFAYNGADSGAGIVINAINTVIKYSVFKNNHADDGACILINGLNATVDNSTFSYNFAFVGAGILSNVNNTNISNSLFKDNHAEFGACVSLYGGNSVLEFCNFENNVADECAGIYVCGDNITVKDSVFKNNNAATGAAISVGADNAVVINSSFINNTASEGAGIYSNGVKTIIKNSTFINNDAYSGAGVVLNGVDSIIEKSFFNDNDASNGAGALINGNFATVMNTHFINNLAENGAGVFISTDRVNICGAVFVGNDAKSGAGIVVNGENISVSNSTFHNNTAGDGSDAIISLNNFTVYVDNATVKNSDTKNLVLKTVEITASVSDLNINFGDDVVIAVKVICDYGIVSEGTVFTVVNGVTYWGDVINGSATITAHGVFGGDYDDIEITYNGSSTYTKAFCLVDFNVLKVNSHIIGTQDFSVFYLENNQYVVRLVDNKGNSISGAPIIFKVDGAVFNVLNTDGNGCVILNFNTLKPGTHTYSVEFQESDSFNAVYIDNKIIVNHILSAKTLTLVKKSAKKTVIPIVVSGLKLPLVKNLKFTYKGKKNVKVSFGEDVKKQTVSVIFNGKTYKVNVNSIGVGVLKLNKKVMKKLKKNKKYLINIQYSGSASYGNVNVAVKFNGKQYIVKTNNYGVAKFKITKKLVKNFKKAKKVKYIISYNGDSIMRYVKIK